MQRLEIADMRRVSKMPYTFTKRESSGNLILYPNSDALRFWNLVSNHGNIRNPITNGHFLDMEEEEKKLLDAADTEMQNLVSYIGIVDKITCLTASCQERDSLIRKASLAMTDWELSRELFLQQQRAWEMLKSDRISRLKEALSLELTDQFPNTSFRSELEGELSKLSERFEFSQWYEAHAYKMDETGRPFFGPGELDKGFMRPNANADWKCPFGKSVHERLGEVLGHFGW